MVIDRKEILRWKKVLAGKRTFKFSSKPSIIALPPACMQKCWKAFLKSGI